MSRLVRRSVSVVAALTLVWSMAGLPVEAAAGAVLAGRVTGADGTSPRPDAVVHLVVDGASDSSASAATDSRGAFRMESTPAGTYRVVVETPEGAFLAAESISLRDGEEPAPLLLALRAEDPQEPGEAAPEATPATPPPAPREGLSTWAKWTIVGVAAVGGGFVIKEVTDEDEASDL